LNKSKLHIERIFCIGRNYVEHAKELGHEIPKAPVVFIKPSVCAVAPGTKIRYPGNGKDLQHEVELVVQIRKEGIVKHESEALSFISAFTIGLDLTLRDVQDELKKKGLPWEKSKCFEQSAPLGELVTFDHTINLHDIAFDCKVNNIIKQAGNSKDMLFPIEKLLLEISKIWILRPGDLIYTGTPHGVGTLNIGDIVEISSSHTGSFSWTIAE